VPLKYGDSEQLRTRALVELAKRAAVQGFVVWVAVAAAARSIRWALYLIAAILIATLSVFGTLLFVELEPRPAVPLTARLSGEWSDVSRAFDGRVRKQFPVGSSEANMASELKGEGFSRSDWSFANSEGKDAVAVRREDNFVCRQAAYVYWRADALGHLTAVRGEYREEGCL
jgi:hypothetical protein